MKKLAVIAFGGNALLRSDEVGTIDQQESNAYNTCNRLICFLQNDYNLVITHGNGPQVGNILLRNEAGYNQFKIPKMPIDVAVADSQGGIGYMIERMMRNVLSENNIDGNVVTLMTQVLIDREDEAFQNPTKPVGAYFLKEEAELLGKANGFTFKEDVRKRGWRRVVPSPKPVDIMNKKIIKQLAEAGNIVISSGGGGVPVYRHKDRHLEAIEAVIDKDLASSLLATEIGADAFYIITDVPKVYVNFNKPNQKALDTVTLDEIKKFVADGEFSAGSMDPKIEAAIKFVEAGGTETVITNADEIEDNNCGTRIVRS